MATKVTMPQLGESVTEGTINQWLVKEGDFVRKYDTLCEVTTDKVNAEVPSAYEGTITEIIAREGETVEVGGFICSIAEAGVEDQPSNHQPSNHQANGSVEETETRQNKDVPKAENMKKRYSPAVLKLAREHEIDLERVQGTGRGGRITRKDLLRLIESGAVPKKEPLPIQEDHPASNASHPSTGTHHATARDDRPQTETPSQTRGAQFKQAVFAPSAIDSEKMPSLSDEDELVSVSNVRKAIAQRMVKSKQEIPHAWTMVEVDATNLVQYRDKIKDTFKRKEGISLTFLPFFIKAVVEALKEYPPMNAQWAGDQIVLKKAINISVAVATEEALYVPVIHQADRKSIAGLAHAVNDLVHRTKTGRLRQEDVQGGTFTVNNTGTFGSVLSEPVINHPQAAIISVEKIVQRPVIIDGMIAVRHMVNLCLSFDHRILDGLIVLRFLDSVKRKVETFGEGTGLY